MLWKIRFDIQKLEEISFPHSFITFFIAPRLQGVILIWKWSNLTLKIGVFRGFWRFPTRVLVHLDPNFAWRQPTYVWRGYKKPQVKIIFSFSLIRCQKWLNPKMASRIFWFFEDFLPEYWCTWTQTSHEDSLHTSVEDTKNRRSRLFLVLP
jgi:hypothetical protein